MFIYSVHIELKASRRDEWINYMKSEHINDVLATGCFVKAEMVERLEPNETDHCHFTTNYYFDDFRDIETYREQHATGLQQDVKKIFGEDFKGSREILRVV